MAVVSQQMADTAAMLQREQDETNRRGATYRLRLKRLGAELGTLPEIVDMDQEYFNAWAPRYLTACQERNVAPGELRADEIQIIEAPEPAEDPASRA